jgi:DNA-binding CsgD family transcriptional regulator
LSRGGVSGVFLTSDKKVGHGHKVFFVLIAFDCFLDFCRGFAYTFSVQIYTALSHFKLGGIALSPPQVTSLPQTLRLSAREKEIVSLLADGLICKEIASRLGISFETVREHCKSIHRKLHVHSKAQLLRHFYAGAIR